MFSPLAWTAAGLGWVAILLTFAVGNVAGDLLAERIDVGYLPSALIFAGASR